VRDAIDSLLVPENGEGCGDEDLGAMLLNIMQAVHSDAVERDGTQRVLNNLPKGLTPKGGISDEAKGSLRTKPPADENTIRKFAKKAETFAQDMEDFGESLGPLNREAINENLRPKSGVDYLENHLPALLRSYVAGILSLARSQSRAHRTGRPKKDSIFDPDWRVFALVNYVSEKLGRSQNPPFKAISTVLTAAFRLTAATEAPQPRVFKTENLQKYYRRRHPKAPIKTSKA